jgi:hypothetical protein
LPLALFAVLACGHAAAPLSAQDARPQEDWASLARYRKANTQLGAPRPGEQRVVFYGNSITDAWAEHFETMFPGKPYVGRGINDIAGNTGPSTLGMIEDNLTSMVELATANGIRVVLASVLPAYDYPWRPGLEPAPTIVALNAWMRQYASTHGIVYLDYHSPMADARQGLRAELTYDGVHPNVAGYQVMAPLAERAIADALGSE